MHSLPSARHSRLLLHFYTPRVLVVLVSFLVVLISLSTSPFFSVLLLLMTPRRESGASKA